MKKLILPLLFFAFGMSAFKSNDKAASIYENLNANYDAFSMTLSKEMIDFFDMDIDMNGKEKLIKGDFTKGRMMVVNDFEGDFMQIKKQFTNVGFLEVDLEDESDKEDDNEVYLLVDRKGKLIHEAHFIVEGDESLILLSIYGKIRLEDIKE